MELRMEAAGYVFTSPAAIELKQHAEDVPNLKADTLGKTKIHLPAIDQSSQVSY